MVTWGFLLSFPFSSHLSRPSLSGVAVRVDFFPGYEDAWGCAYFFMYLRTCARCCEHAPHAPHGNPPHSMLSTSYPVLPSLSRLSMVLRYCCTLTSTCRISFILIHALHAGVSTPSPMLAGGYLRNPLVVVHLTASFASAVSDRLLRHIQVLSVDWLHCVFVLFFVCFILGLCMCGDFISQGFSSTLVSLGGATARSGG